MRIVLALGGNALLQRNEALTLETQRRNARSAAQAIAAVAPGNELIVTHGNGPQIGMLAMQSVMQGTGSASPLDVLNAETDGMIGYLIEQELINALGTCQVATLLTQTEVDASDPAFGKPTKFIGAGYAPEQAQQLSAAHGWRMARDGERWRRVVASPEPRSILEIAAIRQLVAAGFVTICAGGGGIPVVRSASGRYEGIECVVDKDYTSALLADLLAADCLMLLTDVPAVQHDFGTSSARDIRRATPAELSQWNFPAGSMGPKVAAACRFAARPARRACIGRLDEVQQILQGLAGTTVSSPASSPTGSSTYCPTHGTAQR